MKFIVWAFCGINIPFPILEESLFTFRKWCPWQCCVIIWIHNETLHQFCFSNISKSKELPVQVSFDISGSDNCQFWHSEKNIHKSKNHWIQLYQKPQKKNPRFSWRTTKAPAILYRHFSTLFDFFKSSVLVAARPQMYANLVLLVFPDHAWQGYRVYINYRVE
jgi:hypothetical protein